MNKLILLVVTFAAVLVCCTFAISKQIIQEIDFKNATGGLVRIRCQESGDAVTLMDGKSIVVDISRTDVIEISFSDSNQFIKYDLTDLDIKATTDKKKSGKSFFGKVHWVYSCTINKDKALSFKCNDGAKKLEDVILKPNLKVTEDNIFEILKYSASPRLSVKYCKQALEIEPDNAEIHYKLAEAYRDMADVVVKTENEKAYYRKLSKESFRIAEELGYKK